MSQTIILKVVLESNRAKKSSVLIIITVIGFFVIGLIKLFGVSTELNFNHIAIFGGISLLLISNKKKQIIKGIN